MLQECLKPGGVAVLQIISIAEKKFEGYLRSPDFIQLYVFPGGMLPTVTIMREQIAKVGLVLETFEPFGLSYARTLAEWRRRFHAAWPRLRQGGLDEMFAASGTTIWPTARRDFAPARSMSGCIESPGRRRAIVHSFAG